MCAMPAGIGMPYFERNPPSGTIEKPMNPATAGIAARIIT